MIQPFYCGRYVLDAARPLIMGIVNLTDDSFSGDGCASDVGAAREHALRLVAEGAHILDLGAESSRPGAEPVSINQEIDRLLPVIEAIKDCGAVISVDTVKPEVMRVAINAGVDMINDISALRAPGSLELVAQSQVAVSLMHMQGSPRDMQLNPTYGNVVDEIAAFLGERVAAAEAAGIALNRICLDPGFCFGKSLAHNMILLRRLDELLVPGLPVLVGLSRKSMLGLVTGRPVNERLAAGIAAHVLASIKGAKISRVHDVAATRDALAVVSAMEDY